ncbi:hypothetical protein DXG01_004432 [Tephrocybe rancida]|nr:hypothetical protein DXG01_004432 [Tephrocybe rancida]
MDLASGAHICLLAWISNSFPNHSSQRAVALALITGSGQLGGIGASYVFPERWGPKYLNSFGISIAANMLAIFMCFVHKVHLTSLNAKAEQKALEQPGKKPLTYIAG